MDYSLQEAVADIVEQESTVQLSSRIYEMTTEITSLFEAVWLSTIFEVRLAENDTRTDFLVEIHSSDIEKFYAQCLKYKNSDNTTIKDIKKISERLYTKKDCIEDAVIWFECDMIDDVTQTTLVTASIDPNLRNNFLKKNVSTQQAWQDFVKTMDLISDMPITANLESSFKRCADALPFGYNISHIAPLAPRGESGIRLTLYLPPPKIIPWLRKVGWSGAMSDVETLFTLAGDEWPLIGIQIEINEQVETYIGFELMVGSGQKKLEALEKTLLRLQKRDAFDASRVNTALHWNDYNLYPKDEGLRKDTNLKLVVKEAGKVEAKVYLGTNKK
ncbi:hypothetical protein L1077_09765 [Pseudoalteromonas luteoviolacea]|uniref:hypothetical protein n=1 Tax=Pseudoalteromonas luteoviolacea TaxID=43657 RepID=UPI001F17D715|nr:hypothetical protein [Pseudoalteromonas luteoviolacea]MCF6439716.1 hypothetical protein [Pseudoalteromonas luteoviolacea]